MNSPFTTRWGLIGCGWVARDYVIPAIQQASNASLIGVSDRNAAACLGFTRFSLDELLAANIDAVYIATPNNSHAELTIRCAGAGKHILCEKPMATTLEDARHMVNACTEQNVVYATAFDQRFHPAHQTIRRLLCQGNLGTITTARITYACWLPPDWSDDNWRLDPKQSGGGAFVDLAPHGIDLLQYLLDDPIGEIYCLKQRRVFDYSVDDGAVVMCKTSKGCLLTLEVGYNCQEALPRRILEIRGTDGMLIATETMGQTSGGQLRLINKLGKQTEVDFDKGGSPFLNQIEAFSGCLLAGTPFPFSAEGDLRTMRLIASCL